MLVNELITALTVVDLVLISIYHGKKGSASSALRGSLDKLLFDVMLSLVRGVIIENQTIGLWNFFECGFYDLALRLHIV